MNVFIDTNLYLEFYRMGKDKLDELDKVFALHQYGRLKLWLPELLVNEFWRNRSKVLSETIKEIAKDYKPALPQIFRQHEKHSLFNDKLIEASRLKNEIITDIQNLFKEESLAADVVIKRIFDAASKIEADDETIEKGKRRFDLGNPPGKNKSYGDAVNWECLLKAIPNGEDIYIITEDGDYKSAFIKDDINEYLKYEWKKKKDSEPHIYARLSEFIGEHFPQASNLAEMEVNFTIDELRRSGSFATTHRVVAKLLKFTQFTQEQIIKIIDIYFNNDQVGYIKNDDDVKQFARKLISLGDKDKDPEGVLDKFNSFIN
ncbi:PIN domain-containing protein [Escherichia coli]|nr:PIN domain-containing protein [Escherichia coli]